MAIEVELPDGNVVEFPDGTDNATMERALRSYQQGTPKADGPSSYNPTDMRAADGVTRQVGAFGDALQHRLIDLPLGVAQLAGNALNSGIQAVAGGTEWAQGVDRRNAAQNRQVADREAAYQQRTGDTASSYVGSAIGQVAPWMIGLGQLRAAGALPKIGGGVGGAAAKTGLLAAEGAVAGASIPVTSGGYWGEKGQQVAVGAIAAPGLAGLMKGGAMAGRGVRDVARLATSSGREKLADARVAKLYGDDAEIIQRLRRQPATPGMEFTPAQALGTPEAIQTERVLRNNPHSAPAFAERESGNNKALRDFVAGMAKTPDDVAAARAARKDATPLFSTLAGRPVPVKPVEDALELLLNSGMGVNANIKAGARNILTEIRDRKAPDGTIDADILSGLRENAGSHLGPTASAKEKRALGPIKDSIVDALDAAVPGYRDTVAAYARTSQPLTDMATGKALLGAIDSGGRDAGGNQGVSLNQINVLLRKDDRAQYKMSPAMRRQLEAMRDDLQQRGVVNNTIAASGPGTAADTMRGLAGSPVFQRTLSGILGAGGFATGGLPGLLLAAGANEALTSATNSVSRKVGRRAASASATADAIEAHKRRSLPKQQRGRMPLYLLPYANRD